MCALHEITNHTLVDEIRPCLFGVGLHRLHRLHRLVSQMLRRTRVNILSWCAVIFLSYSTLPAAYLGRNFIAFGSAPRREVDSQPSSP